ncbi:MAG: hypothetical protein E6K22_14780 [Gammaproteobacteria bacterium]|nr:MAG: hypothetical protein E6K22_14780 [Gammaproteobacteria bacterium]
MPQQQRPAELRRVGGVRAGELVQLLVEAADRSLEVGERLARIGAHLEPVAQRAQLAGDLLRVGLQGARGLQRADAGAHVRREPESHDQYRAHDHGEHRAEAGGGDELAAACCACGAGHSSALLISD